jgi:DNA polymerase-3 subunit delta
MFLLLHGPDRLRIREKEADLRTKFIEKHDPAGMNTDVVSITDGSEKEMQILGEVLASAPFMATMRMIIVRNALSTIKKANLEDWKRLFTHTPSSTVVLLSDLVNDKDFSSNPLIKELQTRPDVTEYSVPPFNGHDVKNWCLARAATTQLHLTPNILQALIDRCNSDTEAIDNALQKLSAYAYQGTLDTESFDALVPDMRSEVVPFAFLDALSSRNTPETLRILNLLRKGDVEAHALFGLMLRQLRLLCQASEIKQKADLAKTLGIPPFIAQKLLSSIRLFSTHKIKSLYQDFLHADGLLKRGTDGNLVVDYLVAGFLAKK